MILGLAAKGRKTIAISMLAILYLELLCPRAALGAEPEWSVPVPSRKNTFPGTGYKSKPGLPGAALTPAISKPAKKGKGDLGGPTQPESQAFTSVNNANMVDLFSGDFSYSIPLLDVGGYPLAIGYNSGISMDQEASWVGLGWNINPGTITRNMRGLPDDFNGVDTISKSMSIKDNKTIGVSVGGDLEAVGYPLNAGGSVGIFHNNYKGWGTEQGFNVGINGGSKAMGEYTLGLSVTANSQEGGTVGASFSNKALKENAQQNGAFGGNLSVGLSYNSRAGLKALQVSAGIRQYDVTGKNEKTGKNEYDKSNGSIFSSGISFANPTFTPSMQIPYTSTAFSLTLKLGTVVKALHPSAFVSGYVSKQKIAEADKHMSLPAYGYLNYQEAGDNRSVLLDFNREKDIPYREKPAVPHIAVPAYTYDVFSMSGEGTGGSFRAYRSDIGFVHDHFMRTKDGSFSGSLDYGFPGDIVHVGVDLHLTRAYSETGAWLGQNPMARTVAFKKSDKNFEAAYFRNPGEKTVNSKSFYNALGGDDVVAVDLFQSNNSSPVITTTQNLNRYKNKRLVEKLPLPAANAYRKERDKRVQVITYLNAAEAGVGGLSRYIENYTENKFGLGNCNNTFPLEMTGGGVGLFGEYFSDTKFKKKVFERYDTTIAFKNITDFNINRPDSAGPISEHFSARWTGRLKVDETGVYSIRTISDDGVWLFINDSLVIKNPTEHPRTVNTTVLNLVAGQVLNVRMEYFQAGGKAEAQLQWEFLGYPNITIPKKNLYLMPSADTFRVSDVLSREKRVNNFRKANHISEINVLNPDGRRYIYGLPVYNLKQKESTFSVDADNGNRNEGLVTYTPGVDNTTNNKKGNDHYFSSEEIPAYAHTFLLTGLVSPDYADLTGNGISDDDPGDAVRFNYTKTSGVRNPYKWRSPYTDGTNTANYNEGLRTDDRDDKGSYVAGEKELWYMHSIESRNMIATFTLADRDDLAAMDENGVKIPGKARLLKEINLYVKADFLKYNTKAKPVKTVHFDYNYELCAGVNAPVNSSGKLTLKRIWFTYNGNNKGKKNPYVFHYNNNNPSFNGKSYDRWGNFKDPLQNPGSSAGNVITNAEYPYSLQDSALAANNAAAWTLDSIVLPSGGRMKVTYESDDYAYVQNRRAMQMCRIAGFSSQQPGSLGDVDENLYGLLENLYVAIHVPKAVSSNKEVFDRYLKGAEKLFFRLYVKMPQDNYGNGSEYVTCYASTNPGQYGYFNGGQTIWVKLQPIDENGETGNLLSLYSPLAKASIQFLRMNLPSKAYPGSEVGDELDLVEGIKVIMSTADAIIGLIHKFDKIARFRQWGKKVDLNRSMVRLNNPYYKKYGGGLRVKNIRIYDNWNAMTKQKESVYGQEYSYTTTKMIDGKQTEISSGVASYEPLLGGEENPWKQPVEYNQQVSVLAPVNLGYTEEPLGEMFFPAASVGYSKVRVRSMQTKNTRSANGYAETNYYTSYDFPTITDMSLMADGKKRFKPLLANFLRINARHFVTISQGFKVELNDMNGKVRSTATYPETDPRNPISYAEYFYRVDNQQTEFKHLSNTVKAIAPNGVIDPEASIGKDVELMMDMREQRSVTNAYNLNINSDMFSFSLPPIFLLPMLLNLAQREETRFRSVGTTKLINRHGILDSIVAIEKGSRVTTRNLLFDGESGEAVLTSTQNEFNDPVYNFKFPAAWAYEGMSGAYKNINAELRNIFMKDGRISSGLHPDSLAKYFFGGDEILIASKEKVGGINDCVTLPATFPVFSKLYAVDVNAINGGTPEIYFLDEEGKPFTGADITMKIIRSGRRNIAASAGEITMLENPLVQIGENWSLVFNNTSKVIAASAVEYKQSWKVADKKKPGIVLNCIPEPYAAYAEECGPVFYGNQQMSQSFTKNDCGPGFEVKGEVTYIVNANMYSSVISQADANAKAEADLLSNGQTNANRYGSCSPYYYSAAIDRNFSRNNCGEGTTVPVEYHLPEGADSSLVAQTTADSLANIRANIQGQAYANTNGVCTFYSDAVSTDIVKDNCPEGGSPSIVNVQFPAGSYTSTISKAQADSIAWEEAMQYARINGTCTFYNASFNQWVTKNDCVTGTGSEVDVFINWAEFSSIVSQADADAQAAAYAQQKANEEGECIQEILGATMTYVCPDPNEDCEGRQEPTIAFTFSTAPTDTLTLLVGLTIMDYDLNVLMYAGTDIFTPPDGALPLPDSDKPFIIKIPPNVTSYTVPASIWQQGFSLSNDLTKVHTWKCNACSYAPEHVYVKVLESNLGKWEFTDSWLWITNVYPE